MNGPVGPSTELLGHTATMLDRLDERGRTWRAYRNDASVLWAMRRTYRPTMAYGAMHLDTVSNFFEDARSGDLPAVSWIEPRYVGFADPWARADHEQSLVGRVYETIRGAPLEAWYRTLLVVMRCDPGPGPIAGEGAAGEAPSASTIVVSPWTEQGAVSDKALGPASLVSTALQRFCPDPRHFADVGPTVAAATHYGHLLTRATPRWTPSIVPAPTRSGAAGEGESPAVPAAIRAFREEMRMLHERFGRP